ncbi:MAG: hypothetical protein ACKOX6_04700 [Bdellovibrio sp.]
MFKYFLVGIVVSFGMGTAVLASQIESNELYCLIRNTGSNLICQWVAKDGDLILMKADDVGLFIDQAAVLGYITVKSKAGYERVFEIDAKSDRFANLKAYRKTASLSEISKYKSDLFIEIEKNVIKISDDLDKAATATDLVKYDSSIALDKYRRETRVVKNELEGYRKNRETVCTATPAFEQISKVNSALQKSLSGILYALQTPGTCMDDFKVFKDKDGTVDLRQLDVVPDRFTEKCKKSEVKGQKN